MHQIAFIKKNNCYKINIEQKQNYLFQKTNSYITLSVESELIEKILPNPFLSFFTCAPILNLVSALLIRNKHTKLSMHPEKHLSNYLLHKHFIIKVFLFVYIFNTNI